jgi:hypothetical protein
MRLSDISFVQWKNDCPSGINWKPNLIDLLRRCKEFQDLIDKLPLTCSSNVEDMKKIQRHRKRLVKAKQIRNQVRTGAKGLLLIEVNKYGFCNIGFVWKGSKERAVLMNGMGHSCTCPDSDKDFSLCKHTMALILLVNEVMDLLEKD